MSENINNKLTWKDIIRSVTKRKKLVITLFFIGTSFFTILAFILPKKYESVATIMPISSSSPSLGSISDLAALAGFNIGSSDETNKIMVILQSRTLRERVINNLNLIPVLIEEQNVDRNPLNIAVEKLEKKVLISKNQKLNYISIEVVDKDPRLAQKIAQAYIDETRKLLNEKNLSVAKFDRIYLEKKLKEEEEKLRSIQDKLAEFQKKTKLIDPSNQLKSILEMYISLLSKRTELLLKLNSIRGSFSSQNPQIKSLREQISFIDKQLKKIENKNDFFPSLKNIPELLSQYTEIMRELKTSQSIYSVLTKLYQQARLNESKERLFIEVIDPPSLPDIPAKPKKKLLILGGSFISLMIGFLLAVYLECYRENNRSKEKDEK